MSNDYDWCDYCHEDLPTRFKLRAVGFDSMYGGAASPLVKAWCGLCEPGDEIDPVAAAVLAQRLKAQQ